MTTSKITIRAAGAKYTFTLIEPSCLSSRQAAVAADHACTHVLRLDGRKPVALGEEAETAGYVLHVLGETKPHAAGDVGSVTLGLTPIVAVRAPQPAVSATLAEDIAAAARRVGLVPTPATAHEATTSAVPPPARRLSTAEPVRWAAGSRIRLTEAAIAAGHEDRRADVATVRRCAPSQTRPGEFSVRITWDSDGATQPWWAGHFEAA